MQLCKKKQREIKIRHHPACRIKKMRDEQKA